MMERKILWIACSVPCKGISHAGGQTFRYYFFHIANDHRFEVKLIGCDDGMTDDEIKNDLVGIDYRIVHKGVSKLKKLLIWNLSLIHGTGMQEFCLIIMLMRFGNTLKSLKKKGMSQI